MKIKHHACYICFVFFAVHKRKNHVYQFCEIIKPVWTSLERWLQQLNLHPILDKESIILGNTTNELVVNAVIIIITKHEIYKRKWTKRNLSIQYLKGLYKNQMQLEIYLGTTKNQLPKSLGKWASMYNDLIM